MKMAHCHIVVFPGELDSTNAFHPVIELDSIFLLGLQH